MCKPFTGVCSEGLPLPLPPSLPLLPLWQGPSRAVVECQGQARRREVLLGCLPPLHPLQLPLPLLPLPGPLSWPRLPTRFLEACV